jgi:hypothetical protein
MVKGGSRPGASRPKGAINTKTKMLVEAAEAAGIMPREVMLFAMRRQYTAGMKALAEKNDQRADEHFAAAAEFASNVAPYLHARLASSTLTVLRPSQMTDEQLEESIADAENAARAYGLRYRVARLGPRR